MACLRFLRQCGSAEQRPFVWGDAVFIFHRTQSFYRLYNGIVIIGLCCTAELFYVRAFNRLGA